MPRTVDAQEIGKVLPEDDPNEEENNPNNTDASPNDKIRSSIKRRCVALTSSVALDDHIIWRMVRCGSRRASEVLPLCYELNFKITFVPDTSPQYLINPVLAQEVGLRGRVSRRRVVAFRGHLDSAESGWDHAPKSFDVLLLTTTALKNMPAIKRQLLEAYAPYGNGGGFLAAIAAFCQITEDLPGGKDILHQCQLKRDDYYAMCKMYKVLEELVKDETSLVHMPEIQDASPKHTIGLLLRVDVWLGGGRPVYVPCYHFLQLLGHCVGFSYGELMMGAHIYLTQAYWAATIKSTFQLPIRSPASRDEVIEAVRNSLRQSHFYPHRTGVWRNRMLKLGYSVCSGCVTAGLIRMGTASGVWVALVAAAGADMMPVVGPNPPTWGYPSSRWVKMEGRSKESENCATTSLERTSPFTSFQQAIGENAIRQLELSVGSAIIAGLAQIIAAAAGRVTLGFAFAHVSSRDVGVFLLNFAGCVGLLVCNRKHRQIKIPPGLQLMVLTVLNLASKTMWHNQQVLNARFELIMLIWTLFAGTAFAFFVVHSKGNDNGSWDGWIWHFAWIAELGGACVLLLIKAIQSMLRKGTS